MNKHIFIINLFIFGLFFPLTFVQAGTILDAYKYAWSDNVGYINFAPAQSGVVVSGENLSGYAWSENTGYINFAPAEAGVLNDGNGNLSGFAWGEGLGYIDFENVTINTATGKFSGTATGTLIGTLTFDCGFCDVRTDWQPSSGGSSSGSRVGRISQASKPEKAVVVTPPTQTTKDTSPASFLPASAGTGFEALDDRTTEIRSVFGRLDFSFFTKIAYFLISLIQIIVNFSVLTLNFFILLLNLFLEFFVKI
jgi:hypothetical protein